MGLSERLENVTVIGAGGKMGSGIALLLAVEMAKRRIGPEGKERGFRLNLMDTRDDALDDLVEYIRSQATKIAEKSAVELRRLYAGREDLVENGEIIAEFVTECTRKIRLSTDLSAARDSRMVFEAIIENEDVKKKVYGELKKICSPETFFFTNTSSIPIGMLDETAGLEGRLIGFHFYNPPPIQKLVELIPSKRTRPELVDLARELGKALRKKLIPSNDVAGFIGNGHFIRDGLFGISLVEKLSKEHGYPSAVYMVNKVTQDFLVRPMGIFQLIDYVGVDVFQSILTVMNRHIPNAGLESGLVETYVARGVLGGQHPGGAQKDGFLKYGKRGPEGVYDLEKGEYLSFDPEGWTGKADEKLGPLPAEWAPWKALLRDPAKDEKLAAYFSALWKADTLGAKLAGDYMKNSAEIAKGLVADGVAASVEDVNGVLMNGFYHLYGAVNDFVQ